MKSLQLDVVATRGSIIESRHRVHAAVVDDRGCLVAAAGDPTLLTHSRSCAKPFQVMPFVESGAIDAVRWGDDELALACASHGGEPEHVAIAASMLHDLGMEEGARATFELPPGEAFGDRNPDMVQWVARKLLRELGDPHEQYHVGDVVQFPTPDGMGSYAGAVQQVARDADGDGVSDAVLFDFNHPLAGQRLQFEVQLISVL